MVINPPLILVSALFFLALSSLLYVGAWLIATALLRLGQKHITHLAAKRVLMTALVLPPLLAVIPTVDGATFKHTHSLPSAEHHNMLCQEMFAHFSAMTSVHGSIVAGILLNGFAWIAALAGVVLGVRLLLATLRLERGLAPFLSPPSPKLADALSQVSECLPSLRRAQFSECAIPAAYSSVFGLLQVRCVLSREFVQKATEEELIAVVAHEAAHLRANDVWATLIVGTLNCLFFGLRPVRLLGRRWRAAAELACDDAAVAMTQNPLAMASAILRVSGVEMAPRQSIRTLPATTLAFADEAACAPSIRVERLISQAQNASLPVTKETPLQVGSAWALTLLLSGFGIGVLVSAQAACYAHCSLEAVARLLP